MLRECLRLFVFAYRLARLGEASVMREVSAAVAQSVGAKNRKSTAEMSST